MAPAPTGPRAAVNPRDPHPEHVGLGGQAVRAVLQLRHAVREPNGELVVQELSGEHELTFDGLGTKVEPGRGGRWVVGQGGARVAHVRGKPQDPTLEGATPVRQAGRPRPVIQQACVPCLLPERTCTSS